MKPYSVVLAAVFVIGILTEPDPGGGGAGIGVHSNLSMGDNQLWTS